MSTYKVEKYFGHDRGYSCAFRQWGAKSDCRLLHGYSLSFTICLSSSNLTKDNWVYDFGSFDFLKDFLKRNFDHTLLVASDDPELSKFRELDDGGIVQMVVVESTGVEMFAKMAMEYSTSLIQEHYGERCWVESVTVREHGANSATCSI